MVNYILSSPVTRQTKNYFENSQVFLQSLGHEVDNIPLFISYVLKLFEEYLDLYEKGVLVFGFSKSGRVYFDVDKISEEMNKSTLGNISITGMSQGFMDWIERLKISSDSRSRSEVLVYAISYMTFITEIIKNDGEIFLGEDTGNGLRLKFYEIDLFSSYRPRWIH